MKKTFISVLGLLSCIIVQAQENTPPISNIGDLKATSTYTVNSVNRYSWWTNNDGTQVVTRKSLGENSTLDPNDPQQQFAFVTNTTDGNTYVYSVSAKKFIKKNGNQAGLASYAASPITFSSTGNTARPVFIQIKDDNNGWFNDNGNTIVVNDWHNPDDGDQWAIVEATTDFDNSGVQRQLSCFPYQELIDQANSDLNNAKYSDGKDALQTAINTANTDIQTTTTPTEGIQTLQTAIDAFNAAQTAAQGQVSGTIAQDGTLTLDPTTGNFQYLLDFGTADKDIKQAITGTKTSAMTVNGASVNGVSFGDQAVNRGFGIVYNIAVPEGLAGTYQVDIKHCSMNTDRPLSVQVEGQERQIIDSYAGSSDWQTADGTQTAYVNLKEGNNTVIITGDASNQLTDAKYDAAINGTKITLNNPFNAGFGQIIFTKQADAKTIPDDETITLNAQTFTAGNATKENRNSVYGCIGFDANRYADYTINATQGGLYLVDIVYVSGQVRDFNFQLNNGPVANITLPSNGSWDNANAVEQFYVLLNKGANTLHIDGAGTNSPIIDYFRFQKVNAPNFEKDVTAWTLNPVKAAAINGYKIGTGLGEYTSTSYATEDDLQAAFNVATSTSAIHDVIMKLNINFPAEGFYTMYNAATKKYLSVGSDANIVTVDNVDDASPIFFHRLNNTDKVYHMTAYPIGQNFSSTANGIGTTLDIWGTKEDVRFTVEPRHETIGGAYYLQNRGRSLSINANNKVANSGGAVTNPNAAFVLTPVTKLNVTISDLKYATFNAPVPVRIASEGLKAYTGTINEAGDALVLQEITEVPANTPVLLAGDAGTYSVDVIDNAAAVENNALKATTLDSNVPTVVAGELVYFLQDGPNGVGFYNAKLSNGGKDVTSNVFKAYLPVSTTSAAKGISIIFGDGTTTGINGVNADKNIKQDGAIYNLAGQRVSKLEKGGVYIVNGRKVIVK